MYLHLCPECERGNHARCWRTVPSHPPGSYGGSKCRCGCDGNADYDKQTAAPAGNLLEVLSAPLPPAPPTWYTVEELWHHLRRQNYSDAIADELCAHYARNLQLAFNKGYEFAWRESGRARETIPAHAQPENLQT